MMTCLSTARLAIRRFRPEDAADLYEYLSDPRVYRFEPGEPLDRGEASQLAVDMAACPYFWAVVLSSAGKVIGQLYLKQIEPAEHLTCELGYILSPAYHRQGYGSEAASALVHAALSTGCMHRVVAHCNRRTSPRGSCSRKLASAARGSFGRTFSFTATRPASRSGPIPAFTRCWPLRSPGCLEPEGAASSFFPAYQRAESGRFLASGRCWRGLRPSQTRKGGTWRVEVPEIKD